MPPRKLLNRFAYHDSHSTQTTAPLTWAFNSGSETFAFLAAGETYVMTYTIRATDDDERR